jgi:hypothetical protein
MTGLMARSAESDLAAWTDACRLNPAKGAGERAKDDPQVAAAFAALAANVGPAIKNLARQGG